MLCSGFVYKQVHAISDLEVTNIKLNVYNRTIVPDVSRNKLIDTKEKQLQYALSKIIIIWAIENLSLDPSERKLLKTYLDTFFKEDNSLIKNNYTS